MAARLEGANKAFGGRVCVSADTLARAGGAPAGIAVRPIGRLRVKGRTEPLQAFEAFRADDRRADDLGAYLAAYDALVEGEDAAARFAAISRARPEDNLAALHADRTRADARDDLIELKEK